jgi:hypothetical protein
MNRIAQLLILTLLLTPFIYSQEVFYLSTYWEVTVKGGIYNIEAADINRDGHLDIISGNFNDTYVWFGGKALLDSTVDLVYKGRCLAITDFNGDGIKDMITMHFTNFDSLRNDYDGEILFYYGKNTGQYLFDTLPNYSIPLPTLYPKYECFSLGNNKPGIRVGDLNHDGKMDLVISSIYWPYALTSQGKLYIYMGKEVPSSTPDFTLSPNLPRSGYFAEYFEVGDINGDQYDDLLISQVIRSNTLNTFDSLAILYIYYGSQSQKYDINDPSIFYKSKTDRKTWTADWFCYLFSIDDINCDGLKDLVVWREAYKPDSVTAVHYGRSGFNGFDTVANLRLKTPDPTDPNVIVGRGVSQNVGDYNSDGYNDFILNGAGHAFWLILGGPHINNNNPYGLRGYQFGDDSFPNKVLPVGDQAGLGRNDFIGSVGGDNIGWGHIMMFIGYPYVHTDIKPERGDSVKKTGGDILKVYPNPFNSQMTVKYTLKTRGQVLLKLFNSLGQEVSVLKNEEENAGLHEIKFQNDKLPSGIYFLTLNHSGEIVTQKIVLVK